MRLISGAELCVPIEDQVLAVRAFRECLAKLLHHPITGRGGQSEPRARRPICQRTNKHVDLSTITSLIIHYWFGKLKEVWVVLIGFLAFASRRYPVWPA